MAESCPAPAWVCSADFTVRAGIARPVAVLGQMKARLQHKWTCNCERLKAPSGCTNHLISSAMPSRRHRGRSANCVELATTPTSTFLCFAPQK